MTFLDDQVFPVHVSFGTAGGPDWPSEIVVGANEFEERNTAISAPLRTYDARFGVRTPDELYAVLELYYVTRGRLYGFRFLDWTDYRSKGPHETPTAIDQALGVGDASEDTFVLTKRYQLGAHTFDRRITRPYGTLLIAVDGVPTPSGWTLDATTGTVTFTSAPANGAVLTWGGQFHVPARFDCRLDQISHRSAAIGDIPSILLKELRE